MRIAASSLQMHSEKPVVASYGATKTALDHGPGTGREGGDLGHARDARGRLLAHLACRAVESTLSEPPPRSSKSATSTLRRQAQSARSACTRLERERRSVRTPSLSLQLRGTLPAQAASARSEAQQGGHGGWPAVRGMQGGAAWPRGVARGAPYFMALDTVTSDHLLATLQAEGPAEVHLPT